MKQVCMILWVHENTKAKTNTAHIARWEFWLSAFIIKISSLQFYGHWETDVNGSGRIQQDLYLNSAAARHIDKNCVGFFYVYPYDACINFDIPETLYWTWKYYKKQQTWMTAFPQL